MMPDIHTYYPNSAQVSEKVSNRKYLLKVAQTVQYLARFQDDKKIVMKLTTILPSFYFFVEIIIQRS